MQRLTGRSAIAFGTVIAAMEFGWQAVTATALYRGDLQVVLGPAVLISIDAGLLTTPITTTVTSGIPSRDAGAPSGLENTTKQIGGALGFASLIVVAAPAPDGKLDYIPVIASMAAILITIAIIALPIPRQYDRDSAPGGRGTREDRADLSGHLNSDSPAREVGRYGGPDVSRSAVRESDQASRQHDLSARRADRSRHTPARACGRG